MADPPNNIYEMSNYKNLVPQVSKANCLESRTDTSVSLNGSGGGKNSISRERKEVTKRRRRNCANMFYISTFNVQTLSTDDRLTELETVIEKTKWSVIGLSEVRRLGENCLKLKSGHTLYYSGDDQRKIGGVGFLINKTISNNIVDYRSISDRVILIIIKINKRYSCKVIQAYAPTTEYEDEDVENFYEDVNKAICYKRTHYTLLLGDFNAKISTQQDDREIAVGTFGLGERNNRGNMLVNFALENKLYVMNSFFKKPAHRRWTWRSPAGNVKNEIDYILSSNKSIVQDVTVLNSINIGSDHRMVRAKVNFNTKLERLKLVLPKSNKVDLEQLRIMQEEYQKHLLNYTNKAKNNQSLDEHNKEIADLIISSTKKVAPSNQKFENKLSDSTLDNIKKRKELTHNNNSHTQQLNNLNKLIKKQIRADIRQYNNTKIKSTLENKTSLKQLWRSLDNGKTKIISLFNEESQRELSKNTEILKEVETFYSKLYESIAQPPPGKQEIDRLLVTNVGSEEIPDISQYEIEAALNQIQLRKAPGADCILTEMIKYGGQPMIKILTGLYNKCLQECNIPSEWTNAYVILLYKKGDKKKLSNYRPISLLSSLYKLFIKIITNRLTNKLDQYQPIEQAGFRKGYSTLDHLLTLNLLIEKSNEYRFPLWIVFVDYEKAFDSIEIWAVLNALSNCRVDSRYTTLLKNIYNNATFQVIVDQLTKPIVMKRGVRQGEAVSPKLFTLALEDMFKQIDWSEKGIKIDGEYLSHLRFADDVVLFANNVEELQEMLTTLQTKSAEIGLKININKTKYMTNAPYQPHVEVNLNGEPIERVDSYVYLGQETTVSKNNLIIDIKRRISMGWAAFNKLKKVFYTEMPNTLKAQTFDQCVLPVLLYGTESRPINKTILNKLQVTQRAMERRMIGVTLRDRKTNEWIREKSGVTDVVAKLCRQRWSWAGHICRIPDNRWTGKLIEWRPRPHKRPIGRPLTRWTDDIKRHAGQNWMTKAKNRDEWKLLRETYIRRWME